MVDEQKAVCLSLASDSSETIEVIIITLGTMTASDVIMHHVLPISTLTFIQGHTHRHHKNNKLFQKMFGQWPIKFAVKIVRLKVFKVLSQSDDL